VNVVTVERTGRTDQRDAASAVQQVRAARVGQRRRLLFVLVPLALALVAAFALRVLGGDYLISLPDFFRILGGQQIPGASFILMESKLPRAVLGLLVGVAFGTSGAIFQSTLRNPLASPDLLGVSTGASTAAVFGIVVLGISGPALSIAGIIGALATALAIRFMAGSTSGYRLVLVGVTADAALLAVIQYLFTRADEYDAQLALHWMIGSLEAADWQTIAVLAGCLVVLLPLVAGTLRARRALELGPDLATALGVGRWSSEFLLVLAVLLIAFGVAAAGPVAFVAFAAGPIARALNAGRTTLVGSALVGAVAMVASDYLGAYAITDVNLPVGVVTGAFGAPFLLWMLAAGRTGRRVS
jgi:iron complex transport system permease protein